MEPPTDDQLAGAVAQFKVRLGGDEPAMAIVREQITHGLAMVLPDDAYAHLRECVGERLSVSPNQSVFLVGSAKLGFSIKPKRRYGYFCDESDVDLAVVAPNVYERLWGEARRYSRQGGFWENDSKIHFKNDHANSVIKPYVLPDSDSIPTRRELFDLEAELQRIGASPYPVTIALWHSMDALEEYQVLAVTKCREALTL